MGLQYPAEWRFNDGGGRMPAAAVEELVTLVERVASQADDPQPVYEIFKARFGNPNRSSSAGWAQSDMSEAMSIANRSIPEFIEAYWAAMEEVGDVFATPLPDQINSVLRRHGVGYAIKPPRLIREATSIIAARSAVGGNSSSWGYILGDRIGGGGFGEVHKAIRPTLVGEFEFAIKLHHPSVFADQERALKRFEREVGALQKLQHRAIVPYVDAGVSMDGKPFLVMPLIKGQGLRDATSPDNPQIIVRYMVELLRAVEYAHSLGVFHRDLKPANILVRASDSQVIIVDFGLAYLYEEMTLQSLTTGAIGTPQYMPPEVANNPRERNQFHDIFSCGIILYELIARQLPDRAYYEPLAQRDSRLARFDKIIVKALAPVKDRYQSAGAFCNDLIDAYSVFQRSP